MSERRYSFGPLEQRAVIGPLRPGQVVIVAAGALIGLACVYGVGGFAGVIGALVSLFVSVAVISVPIGGRSAEEWAPVALAWLARGQKRSYRSSAPSAGIRGALRGAE